MIIETGNDTENIQAIPYKFETGLVLKYITACKAKYS